MPGVLQAGGGQGGGHHLAPQHQSAAANSHIDQQQCLHPEQSHGRVVTLAYKLASKRSLGSIFNQNIFFLFIVTIIPSSISSSEILRDSTQPSLAAVYCISAWCRGTLGKTFRSSVARRSGGSTPSSSTSTSGIYQPHKKCLSCFNQSINHQTCFEL